MPGRQVRMSEEVLRTARSEQRQLGFAAEAPIGTVVSELVMDGIEHRRLQHLQMERASLYAAWADEDDLHEDVLETTRWTIEAGGVQGGV
jgi:2-hydroxychromene-2-carboxylate isomerase